jgi:hypothetical protein
MAVTLFGFGVSDRNLNRGITQIVFGEVDPW